VDDVAADVAGGVVGGKESEAESEFESLELEVTGVVDIASPAQKWKLVFRSLAR
jgi:hypothetical protein